MYNFNTVQLPVSTHLKYVPSAKNICKRTTFFCSVRLLVLFLVLHFPNLSFATYLDLPKDTNGWTVFTPSANTRIMYVSATGNDSSGKIYSSTSAEIGIDPFQPSGQILPFATISAAMSNIRIGYPDWVLLKRGDTFTVTSTNPAVELENGKSLSEPSLVGAYGSSKNSPIVRISETVPIALHISRNSAYQYMAISGIDFYSYTRDPNNVEYRGATGSMQVGVKIYKGAINGVDEGLLIEGCKFRFFNNNVIQTDSVPIDGLAIRRNLFMDNWSGEGQGHSQGLYIEGQSPLFEENIFIHNGWLNPSGSGEEGEATMFNHNLYMSRMTGGTFSKNIIAQGSNSNVKIAAGPISNQNKMKFNNNLLIDSQYGLGFANNYVGNTAPFKNIEVSENVISDMGRSKNLQGIARGIAIPYDTDGAIVNDNIILNQKDISITESIAFLIGGIQKNVTIYRNIAFNLKNTVNLQVDDKGDGNSTGSAKANINMSDNRIQTMENSGYIANLESTTSGLAFANNKYFSSKSDGTRFKIAGVNKTNLQWNEMTGDNSSFEQVSFPEPTRSIETYMQSLGEIMTIEAFLMKCRAQDRYNWNELFMAIQINDWIRRGFYSDYNRLSTPRDFMVQ